MQFRANMVTMPTTSVCLAFLNPPWPVGRTATTELGTWPSLSSHVPSRKAHHAARRPRRMQTSAVPAMSTEDVFAVDAGRDLFFTSMDQAKAIEILDVPLGDLPQADDRFIAAERLKFYPSEDTTLALMRFVQRFDLSRLDQYVLEERIARRKAVETLGRLKGQSHKARVVDFLKSMLQDPDHYLIEAVVWSLGEIGVTTDADVLHAVAAVLDNEQVDKRVIVHTLLRAKYTPALPTLQKFVDSDDVRLACASRAAVAVLTGDDATMGDVVSILRDQNLNNRRCAIEDITLAKYVPALHAIAACPNSLVLRSRTVRVLLDAQHQRHQQHESSTYSLDLDTVQLLDRLIWDHPHDLDLLGTKKETKKSRDVDRNIKQLYKNDALFAYLASQTLAEDHRCSSTGSEDNEHASAGSKVLKSYNDLKYFDYFGAYHVYKTLGWLKYEPGFDLLLKNAKTLPPRFFNHKAGAITALAELGNEQALPVIEEVAAGSQIWELTYASVMAAERLGDGGKLKRKMAQDSEDWLIRARCQEEQGLNHLKEGF